MRTPTPTPRDLDRGPSLQLRRWSHTMHNAPVAATGSPLSLRRGSHGKFYEDSLFRGSRRGCCFAARTNMRAHSVALELELEL